jgi:hypothetical protein
MENKSDSGPGCEVVEPEKKQSGSKSGLSDDRLRGAWKCLWGTEISTGCVGAKRGGC